MAKFWGGVLITLAFVLSIAILGFSPYILATFIGLIMSALGKTEAYVTGVVFIESMVWICLIALAALCWRYGLRISVKKP